MKYAKLFMLSLVLLASLGSAAPARAGGTWNWGTEAPPPPPPPVTPWYSVFFPFLF